MATQHERAVKQAERTNAKLRVLFGQLGNAEHPRGKILSAYRTARKALKASLNDPRAVDETLGTLRAAVQMAATESFAKAREIGTRQAGGDLAIYDIFPTLELRDSTQDMAAIDAVMQTADVQITRTKAALSTGAAGAVGLVLGDGVTRLGIVQPAPVTTEAARWVTALALASWLQSVNGSVARAGMQTSYVRQAVAGIDERTTDCCLRVHGQTRALDKPFKLTGTPRFADEVQAPPFHWYCRTAVALVRAEDADDALSQQMRKAARDEVGSRAVVQEKIDGVQSRLVELGAAPDARIRKGDTGQLKRLRRQLRTWREKQRQTIHPAHARSRR